MRLFNQLNSASFRGVTFLLDSNELDSGRKTTKHEFPNKKARYVEDLGGLLRTFRVKGTITEPNYRINRDAMISALETPGIGTLIHPLYGTVQVVPDIFTLSESMQRLGEATFDMTFYEAVENTFPIQAIDNTGLINQISELVLTKAATNFSNLWEVTRTYKFNFINAQSILTTLGNQFNSITDPSSSDVSALSTFKLLLSFYMQNLNKNILESATLGTSIQDLFLSLDSVSTDGRERYSVEKQFFSYGSKIPLPPLTTFQRQQLIQNNKALYDQVNISSLANAYNAAITIDFVDEDELLSIENDLDTQYFYTIDNAVFDEDVLNDLKNLRNQARLFFERTRVNVRKLVQIITQGSTITTLIFAYYNALENDSLIMDINSIYVPNNLEGDLLIVANQ